MNQNEPLTPEERELARLLGRSADKAPPPALDAAILAAARASVQATPEAAAAATSAAAPRAQRPRQRWPAVFGVAASVVFAVGLAWQLRPEPPPVPVLEASTASAPADASAAADTGRNAATAPAAADLQAAPMAAAAPEADAAPAAAVARRTEPVAAKAKVDAVPTPQPQPISTPPAKRAVVPPSPPAPPAPPPPAAPAAFAAPAPMMADSAGAPAAAMAEDTVVDRVAEPAPAPAARAMARQSAPGVMRRSVAGALSAEAVRHEVDADAQLPRRQWLMKIRERRNSGQQDLARASLERYLQQYPEARLPKDLRPLLDD